VSKKGDPSTTSGDARVPFVDDKLQVLQMSLWVYPIRTSIAACFRGLCSWSLTPASSTRRLRRTQTNWIEWSQACFMRSGKRPPAHRKTNDFEQAPKCTIKSLASGHYPNLQIVVYRLSRIQAGFVFSSGRVELTGRGTAAERQMVD